MKNTLIFLSVLLTACGTEVSTSTHEQKGKTRLTQADHPNLRLDYKSVLTTNIHQGVGNMISTDLSGTTTQCCDTQITTNEFTYFYSSMPNGFHFVEAYADTLIDYNTEMAVIDVYGYNSLVNGCPSGFNLSYAGANCLKEVKITWDREIINVANCHYINAKLRIFPNQADTLYVQVFKGQPVTMTFNKYWKQ